MLGAMDQIRAAVEANLCAIEARIAAAATRVGRDPSEVLLVGAAKTVSPEVVRCAVEAGLRAVGENYVQELRGTHRALDVDPPTIQPRWHFIGTLQSGTAHHVADLADVVETLSGERAARRLAGRAARADRSLDVFLEIDYTGERGGLAPGDVHAAASTVDGLEGLHLRGLMTIPPLTATPEEARPWFARLRDLRDDLRRTFPDVLDLSMGMSLDYEVAIEEGATIVRIGTALFGPRTV
jgi:pyridoxal phosphate enzyme (YggS family)